MASEYDRAVAATLEFAEQPNDNRGLLFFRDYLRKLEAGLVRSIRAQDERAEILYHRLINRLYVYFQTKISRVE